MSLSLDNQQLKSHTNNIKATKTYNEGSVEYKHIGAGKWEFIVAASAYRFISKSPQGVIGAEKIAKIVSGSVKRCGVVDGLARELVSCLLSPKRPADSIVF